MSVAFAQKPAAQESHRELRRLDERAPWWSVDAAISTLARQPGIRHRRPTTRRSDFLSCGRCQAGSQSWHKCIRVGLINRGVYVVALVLFAAEVVAAFGPPAFSVGPPFGNDDRSVGEGSADRRERREAGDYEDDWWDSHRSSRAARGSCRTRHIFGVRTRSIDSRCRLRDRWRHCADCVNVVASARGWKPDLEASITWL